VARQRKAIVDGLKESVVEFNDGVAGTSPADVMQLMMVTQYLDMLKEVGTQKGGSTVVSTSTHGIWSLRVMSRSMLISLVVPVHSAWPGSGPGRAGSDAEWVYGGQCCGSCQALSSQSSFAAV